MSSQPEPVYSSSPTSMSHTSIRNTSPVRIRENTTTSDISDISSTSRPRLSPTLSRAFDPNDPDARERQRTMDADMAIQLSRARRDTVSVPSPTFELPPSPETPLPAMSCISPHEQHEIDIARGQTSAASEHGDIADELTLHGRPGSSLADLHEHLHQTHDPSLLVSLGSPEPPHTQFGGTDIGSPAFGLPTYQANVSRSNFDFSPMEAFAAEEKAVLGITSPNTTTFAADALRPRSLVLGPNGDGPSDLQVHRSPRLRKLSQSATSPRLHRKGGGRKMALFEGNPGEPPPSLPGRLGLMLGQGAPFAHSSSLEHAGAPGTGILNTGHDRPYRFSFYSNALSATIHARSLSELPADGQSFEDLFSGLAPSAQPERTQGNDHRPSTPADLGRRPGPGLGAEAGGAKGLGKANGATASYFGAHPGGKGEPIRGITGGMMGGGDSDGSTWWLDVQSPTDEEMKMLSKVFSIHPLTTEDIQMEETREKIELFRNYYLVCFRSFDQDQYSPTHLEPLNMYIIVFREGILSFHFRPTPHPQNVRRRIQQLKDYISVTSDWISYALIDDITDAFGPLIQSIEYEVDSIDELVLILKETEQSDMLRRIGTCRKKVMGLLRLMGNKADVVKGLAKRCNENWRVAPTSDIGLYLSDIQDHLITMTQNLNHYEKILSRSHSNYLAQISIEMTDANNQINDVLSKLTALGTVLIPMNLVTGLWGMNVHVPGQDVPGFAWFVSIIAGLVAFALIGGYSTYKLMSRR